MNCKHGLLEGTCAYCTGLITKATVDNYDTLGSQSGLQILGDSHSRKRKQGAMIEADDYDSGNYYDD